MMTHELGPRPIELTIEKPQLVLPTGILAVRGAIAETFAMANEYVAANQDLIGYRIDQIPADLQILHQNDATLETTKFGIYLDTEQVHTIDLAINRGTTTHRGNLKFDDYILTLEKNTTDAAGLILSGGDYRDTQLVALQPEGEYEFSEGIGPKRQMRALNVLRIMQDRIHQIAEIGA